MVTNDAIDSAIAKYAAGVNRELASELYASIATMSQEITLMIAAMERWSLYQKIGLTYGDQDCSNDIYVHLHATMSAFAHVVDIFDEKSTAYRGDYLVIRLIDYVIRVPLENFIQKNGKKIEISREDDSWIPDLHEARYLRSCIWLALTALSNIKTLSLDARQYRDGDPTMGGNLPDVGIWDLLSKAISAGCGIPELATKLVDCGLDCNRNHIRSRPKRIKNERDRLEDAHRRWIERISRRGTTSE